MESANKMNSFIFLMLFLVGLVKCDSDVKLPDDFVSKASQQGKLELLNLYLLRHGQYFMDCNIQYSN